MTDCARCSACCRLIPMATSNMTPEHRKYLLIRGLQEEQGFILIPHECQHLQFKPENRFMPGDGGIYSCDIHDSPDRPFVCRKFTGQKQIGRWRVYVPPSCAFNKKP